MCRKTADTGGDFAGQNAVDSMVSPRPVVAAGCKIIYKSTTGGYTGPVNSVRQASRKATCPRAGHEAQKTNQSDPHVMKRMSTAVLSLSVAWFSFNAPDALAEYVTPRVAPIIQAQNHPHPPPTPGVLYVTNTRDDGPGSLRAAIANAAPGNTIRFAIKRLPATILLRSTLVIDKDLTILGPGPKKLAVVRRPAHHAPKFRIFQVDDGIVTIAGLSIANGRALNPDGNSDNLGGGILNWSSLTVSNCVVAQNAALAEAGGSGFGGGIFTIGPLRLVNSTIRGNNASFAGGGVCTFHANNVQIEGCTISGNFAGIQGGGLNFQGRTGSLKNSTVSGNKTLVDGTASALLHLTFGSEASDLDISECTIVDNCGNTNAAVVIAGLPGNLGINTRMIGTLVANNLTQNFFLDGDATLQSLGHNLDSDGSSGLTDGVNGDLVGTAGTPLEARLGPLQDNGGPTRTHALLPGSPALDAGVGVDVNGNTVATDQRGLPRPQGAACDIGAFENQPPDLRCPTAKYVESCHGDLTASVFDPDGDPLVVVWFVDAVAYRTNIVAGSHPPCARTVKLTVSLPPGSHTIGLSVSDGKADPVECSTTVTARDHKPPKIWSIKTNPKTLSPASQQLLPVQVTVDVEDACGPVTCKIVSVGCNEPVSSGPDWIISGNLTALLRAKCSGNNSARVYKINVVCRDAAGNTSLGSTEVIVPRHQ